MDDPTSVHADTSFAAERIPGQSLDSRDLVMRFESLGGTGHGCEFGLFQRHFDAEPVGLLRWADLSHDLLTRALETRFDGVGMPENTIVFNPDHSDEWWTRDTRFWMAMRSFVKVADVDQERMTVMVCRRLQGLRRKLIEDLEAGDKIFAFKNLKRNLTDTELAQLHAAIRSYGDTTLFYIRYADETHPAGTVEAMGPGLLVGFIDHFSFTPDDKPLGAINDALYALCERAYEIQTGRPVAQSPSLPRPVVLPSRSRRVALIGNCQAQAMTNLYQKFAAGRTGDILTHVPSYEDLTEEDRATIERADLVVEQLFDIKPQADVAGIAAGTPRLFIPMVTAGFLWPFAGQAHPRNADCPFLVGGPYGGEASDSYLNRLILAGTDPEEAVEAYMDLDVRNRTNLDRLYELIIDRQRSRDEAAEYRISEIIEQHFRSEQIFLSPYHPNVRVAVSLATQFFQQMGASPQDIARMQACTRVTPFPKGELPIHPSVARHFGMDFVTPDRRYRFLNEGLFTFREYALRYMRYEWNEALEEGMSLARAGKLGEAHDRLVAAITCKPDAAAAHNSLSHVLVAQNRLEEGAAEIRRAIEIEPDFAAYRANYGVILRRMGQLEEAEAQLRQAVIADPVEPHNLILLAHVLRQRGQAEEGCALIRAAIDLDPYSPKLFEELADFLEATGDVPAALRAMQQAVELAPERARALARLCHLFGRNGQLAEAEAAVRSAVALDPKAARLRIVLSDILLRQNKHLEALNEVLLAAVTHPDDAEVYSHLGHLLQRDGDPAAEAAFRRAAEMDPANAHIRHQLSEILHKMGRSEEAIAVAREATELEPGNAHRFEHLARLFLAAGDEAGAVGAQQRAVQLNPDNRVFRVVLSDLLARQGRQEEALAEARIAGERFPDSAHAVGHLAHVLQLVGDLEESERMYMRALEIESGNEHLQRQLSYLRSRRVMEVTS